MTFNNSVYETKASIDLPCMQGRMNTMEIKP